MMGSSTASGTIYFPQAVEHTVADKLHTYVIYERNAHTPIAEIWTCQVIGDMLPEVYIHNNRRE
jgi:hypothetical protein